MVAVGIIESVGGTGVISEIIGEVGIEVSPWTFEQPIRVHANTIINVIGLKVFFGTISSLLMSCNQRQMQELARCRCLFRLWILQGLPLLFAVGSPNLRRSGGAWNKMAMMVHGT